MSWRAGIHGYAAQFNVPLWPRRPAQGQSSCTAPVSAHAVMFEPGCFRFDAKRTAIMFMHRDFQTYGTGEDIELKLWQDSYGLAFTFRPPSTAYSLVAGIADGRYAECSAGWSNPPGALGWSNGGQVEAISTAYLSEISIVAKGACPGTACWHSANVAASMPSHAQALVPKWVAGFASASI